MEAYRVLKDFQWNGWHFASDNECRCGCGDEYPERCTAKTGSGCPCSQGKSSCHCRCGVIPDLYGGTVWFVDEGNPRKEMMLAGRYAIYDASIASVDDLLKEEQYSRLLKAPTKRYVAEAKKAVVAAGR